MRPAHNDLDSLDADQCAAVNADGSCNRLVRAPTEQQLHGIAPARVDVRGIRRSGHPLILTNRRGLVDGDLLRARAVDLVSLSRD